MNSMLTQLGVGGILAILVLREVFNFLKNKNHKKEGCGEVSRTEFERHKDVVQYRSTCDEIVKRFDEQFVMMNGLLKEIKQMVGDLKI